ncbi:MULTISPECIES: helix-turn-helix transcriptional regulator [unclassified Dietzia]|uniref:ArsR/SmtB family transcription factor n=1 Tax=unclassified Dietzia TaxID=2617939 RepID=UPI000D1FE146|nr:MULTISPECIES: helix-turn-helix domain-containing protein [unclassified Dietzia]AVZ40823.1 ArsR family transcriptional regulator [Dietzia sp. JS16-p6b]
MADIDRIEALERRVAALEAHSARTGHSAGAGQNTRTGHSAGTTAPERAADDDTFWALEGLRSRTSDPGAVMMVGSVRTPKGYEARWQMAEQADDLFASDFADRAESLSALAHPVRLRIVQRILSDADTVQDLVATGEFGTSGQIYHHLRQLSSHGWLRAAGSGRYEVPAARVVPLLTILLGVDR